MRSTKYLSAPLYLISGLLLVLPMLDFVLAVSPMRIHTTSWRFGAEGIAPRALLTPVLGLLIWFLTGWFLEQGLMLRIIAVISGWFAVFVIAIGVSFALDGIEMRAQVAPAAATVFKFTLATTLMKDVVFLVTGLVLARSSWKCAGRLRSARQAASGAAMLMHDPALRAGPAPTQS